MAVKKMRSNGRTYEKLRPIDITIGICEYADGSVLFQMGKTKVLCTVTLQSGVPVFLRGQHTGWLTAEYAMLPTATQTRKPRESSTHMRNGRSIEISRVIGRTLRTIVDLSVIRDATITVDCDVIQADGGTRAASISGAYIALYWAQKRWLSESIISKPLLLDSIGAVSVGVSGTSILLDPDYHEDTLIDADFNFIVTGSGNLIEIQGGAEKSAITWDFFDKVRQAALVGIEQLFDSTKTVLKACDDTYTQINNKETRAPLFSLKNRMHNK